MKRRNIIRMTEGGKVSMPLNHSLYLSLLLFAYQEIDYTHLRIFLLGFWFVS